MKFMAIANELAKRWKIDLQDYRFVGQNGQTLHLATQMADLNYKEDEEILIDMYAESYASDHWHH